MLVLEWAWNILWMNWKNVYVRYHVYSKWYIFMVCMCLSLSAYTHVSVWVNRKEMFVYPPSLCKNAYPQPQSFSLLSKSNIITTICSAHIITTPIIFLFFFAGFIQIAVFMCCSKWRKTNKNMFRLFCLLFKTVVHSLHQCYSYCSFSSCQS
jgi:hypothetical protein